MYNDYIITVDENGEPYIAHAFGIGSWIKRVVKYDKKEPDGKGGWRYYYNTVKRKAGTAAKKAWGSKAGRWIDSHDAGITERIMANRLSRKAKRASRKGYNDDAMAYSKRSAELRRESKSEREAAKKKLKGLVYKDSGWQISEKEGTPLEKWYIEHFGKQAYQDFIDNFNKDKETSSSSSSNRPTSHQKNVTGTAKEDSLKLRSTTGASELNALRENYEKTKVDYNSAQLGINKRSGQEKLSYQNAMKNAEKEYLQKRDDISKKLDQRLSSNGYTKRQYPTGNSSGINPSTLVNDSKSAGVDRKFIEEYQNAVRDYQRAYKEASDKYEKRKNSSGVQPLYSRMPWNDPEVEAANRRKSDLEELLVRSLYDERSLPSFYKKK